VVADPAAVCMTFNNTAAAGAPPHSRAPSCYYDITENKIFRYVLIDHGRNRTG